MKKSLILGILGLSALTMSSHAQGILFLQNYTIAGAPYVLYGSPAPPANGVSGPVGTPGTALGPGWTVGFYWAAGTVSIPTDPFGGESINPLLTLATGFGSTASTADSLVFGTPGAYQATGAWVAPGVAGGGTITMETVVYNSGAGSYNSATYRAHSDAFQVVLAAPTGSPTPTGLTSLPMSVQIIPEPSVLALSSLGAAALMLTRKKKAATDN